MEIRSIFPEQLSMENKAVHDVLASSIALTRRLLSGVVARLEGEHTSPDHILMFTVDHEMCTEHSGEPEQAEQQ